MLGAGALDLFNQRLVVGGYEPLSYDMVTLHGLCMFASGIAARIEERHSQLGSLASVLKKEYPEEDWSELDKLAPTDNTTYT